MNILVTGGAGYIGSALSKRLLNLNHNVIIIDNCSEEKQNYIDHRAKTYKINLNNKHLLKKVFEENEIDVVMHLASYKDALESMTEVSKYSKNIITLINLLDCMVECNVKKIIFSSSAAVYGNPNYTPIDEKHSTNPTNYYGFTKLKCEEIINWYSKLKGIIGINLRYFNVGGDAGLNYIDKNATNVFSILMETIEGKRNHFNVYGNDYNTRDGTCIRDYIDVNDLIEAHILALKLNHPETINLGTEKGITTLELIKNLEEVSGKNINYIFQERREGDIEISTASYQKAKSLIGWEPKKSLKEMLESLLQVTKREEHR